MDNRHFSVVFPVGLLLRTLYAPQQYHTFYTVLHTPPSKTTIIKTGAYAPVLRWDKNEKVRGITPVREPRPVTGCAAVTTLTLISYRDINISQDAPLVNVSRETFSRYKLQVFQKRALDFAIAEKQLAALVGVTYHGKCR